MWLLVLGIRYRVWGFHVAEEEGKEGVLGDEVTDVTTNSEGTLVGTPVSDPMLSSFGSESTPPSLAQVFWRPGEPSLWLWDK